MHGRDVPNEPQSETEPDAVRQILIVDPDDEARLLYRETLRRAGYDMLEAPDGRDALTKALVRVPSLVITELRLPFIDGFALLDILRRDRTTAGVPVLVITTDVRPSEADRFRGIADAILTKPTTPEALLAECTRLLDRVAQARDRSGERDDRSGVPPDPAESRRSTMRTKAFPRFATTEPPIRPPALTCPSCDRALTYLQSHVGGVSDRHPEQWDYFSCTTCGTFQYRQRTRKTRRVDFSFVDRDVTRT
jgi:two-component system, chemotaxis family, chemotaxis protein CheY